MILVDIFRSKEAPCFGICIIWTEVFMSKLAEYKKRSTRSLMSRTFLILEMTTDFALGIHTLYNRYWKKSKFAYQDYRSFLRMEVWGKSRSLDHPELLSIVKKNSFWVQSHYLSFSSSFLPAESFIIYLLVIITKDLRTLNRIIFYSIIDYHKSLIISLLNFACLVGDNLVLS
jgi:hypothetical protein